MLAMIDQGKKDNFLSIFYMKNHSCISCCDDNDQIKVSRNQNVEQNQIKNLKYELNKIVFQDTLKDNSTSNNKVDMS